MTPEIAYWNDDRVAILRDLWAQGKSCAQMARLMPLEPSRNTIIGKLARLKLRLHPSRVVVKRKSRPRAKAPPKVKSLRQDAPRVYQPFSGTVGAWEALEGSSPIALVDHVTGCRWPIGEDRPFKFCGLPVAGLSYCAEHQSRSAKHL